MNDENLSRASGVTDVQGETGNSGPPPAGTEEQQRQAADALEHPRIGGDVDSPSGVRDNATGEPVGGQGAVLDGDVGQGGEGAHQQNAGAQEDDQRDFAGEADQSVDELLDHAESALNKTIAHNAGDQMDEPLTEDEASALGKVSALMPHLSGAASPAIQQTIGGASPPQPNNAILQDLLLALRFIRILRGGL